MHNATRGTVLAEHVTIADSIFTRARGLLGTRALPARHGMLIRRSRQVHSFFMLYALDLVFIDEAGHVIRTLRDFAQNRLSPLVWHASSVLELPAGTLAGTPVEPGDMLRVEPRDAFAGGGTN